ncbi:nucleosome assembly protein [Phaeodactylum tricornutum CCAP 1055/1]|jgi:nucleosome assembly protein 1-like 1|uniref:Nucleosome assembly protein n=3 Tax=Phaeodactylum tricornutum TaxID=2850 RepID=B7FQG1_PHATC|nr:nucleosome assembly protein [Phaeodactylum tricornutum CCAP 1055/1]EEC51328.1 nucleosome assembly protein [Phaeodactylum tricornutum CCAP 1055/1]|eukprot:XP_002176865.1 nucleosome assembly protein [Phaeodactylum tricornutum CCAP 1055/1]
MTDINNNEQDPLQNIGVGDEDSDAEDDDTAEDNPMADLPDYVAHRVEKLRGLNEKREEIMKDYLTERADLERKYAVILNPLYEERATIVNGEKDDEISAEVTRRGDSSSAHHNDAEPYVKGIPQFWLSTMSQEETISESLTEEDVDCLEHLENITCEDFADGKGFVLRFHFAPNDYFHDAVLVKTYDVPNLLLSDEPILKNVHGCKIQWKEGKSLTHRQIKKKQRGKGKNAGQVRTISKMEKKESFFHWFEPPAMPKMDEVDEEQADELEEFFDSDYEIAQAFRSHVIPSAVLWFTGEIMAQEMIHAIEDLRESEETD